MGSPQNGLGVQITDGATKGGLEGGGKLFLRDEGKSFARFESCETMRWAGLPLVMPGPSGHVRECDFAEKHLHTPILI